MSCERELKFETLDFFYSQIDFLPLKKEIFKKCPAHHLIVLPNPRNRCSDLFFFSQFSELQNFSVAPFPDPFLLCCGCNPPFFFYFLQFSIGPMQTQAEQLGSSFFFLFSFNFFCFLLVFFSSILSSLVPRSLQQPSFSFYFDFIFILLLRFFFFFFFFFFPFYGLLFSNHLKILKTLKQDKKLDYDEAKGLTITN
jgi:hypothetical protein